MTAGYRIHEANPGHVTIDVFIGRIPLSRGRSGRLVIRKDEWPTIRTMLEAGGFDLALGGLDDPAD